MLQSGSLYEDVKTETQPTETTKKCSICGEVVDAIQYARHVIKKHSDKSK